MIDFKDVTFIIPVRFDSEDRKRNFRITIAFLEKHFDTNIIVMESDKTSNEEFVKSISEKLTYVFEKNDSHLFHRTKMLNDIIHHLFDKFYDPFFLFFQFFPNLRDPRKQSFHFPNQF